MQLHYEAVDIYLTLLGDRRYDAIKGFHIIMLRLTIFRILVVTTFLNYIFAIRHATFKVFKNVTTVDQKEKLGSVRACITVECALACVGLPSCLSARFHATSKTCDLYTGVQGYDPTDDMETTTISVMTECTYQHTQIGTKR